MISAHIDVLLGIFGVLAMAMIIVTLAPRFALERLLRIEVRDEAGRFFARHWGAMAFACGALLVWAARDAALREPVMIVVGLEKLVLIALVFGQRQRPMFRALLPAALCDAVAVTVFGLYFAGA